MGARELETGSVKRIGEYLIGRLVGEGGMGKVYEAEERLSKRRVALKVLRPELARSEEGRRLFLNEMTILAHLDHPNIVRCLACTEADGELFMVLELLDGQTLRDLLNEAGGLDWEEATEIVSQVAAALDAAHQQAPPIIHRDLKPENIMILADGSVKVMDFGIAKVLEAISRTTTNSVGTLQYMSPEQIDAQGVDARSDLYSLGLVLFELLTGKPPFECASPRELLNMQCTVEPPSLDDDVRVGLPSGVERLLYQLLEKSPERRPATAEEVCTRLEPFRSATGAKEKVRARKTERGTTKPSGDQTSGAEAPTQPMDLAPTARPRTERADTIALLDIATEPRQVPVWMALTVAAGLSIAAGLATYLVRSNMVDTSPSSESAETVEPTETAASTERTPG